MKLKQNIIKGVLVSIFLSTSYVYSGKNKESDEAERESEDKTQVVTVQEADPSDDIEARSNAVVTAGNTISNKGSQLDLSDFHIIPSEMEDYKKLEQEFADNCIGNSKGEMDNIIKKLIELNHLREYIQARWVLIKKYTQNVILLEQDILSFSKRNSKDPDSLICYCQKYANLKQEIESGIAQLRKQLGIENGVADLGALASKNLLDSLCPSSENTNPILSINSALDTMEQFDKLMETVVGWPTEAKLSPSLKRRIAEYVAKGLGYPVFGVTSLLATHYIAIVYASYLTLPILYGAEAVTATVSAYLFSGYSRYVGKLMAAQAGSLARGYAALYAYDICVLLANRTYGGLRWCLAKASRACSLH